MRPSILRCILLLLVTLPGLVIAQTSENGREIENPKKRREHYYHVRSYPFGRIPQNARLDAIYSMVSNVPSYVEKAGGLHALNAWRLIGPSNVGGRINAIAVHPTDGNTLYAGAASGGVWKSTNRGDSWTPIMDFENAIWIGALAIDPTNPSTIYAGTGDPHPSNGDSYPGAGVFKSTDAGATWRAVGLTNVGSISGIVIDRRNPNIIVVGGSDNNAGIYRSEDAGTTWTRVSSQSVANMVINPQNPDQIWIATWADGIFRSDDLGRTWQPRNQGLAVGATTVKQRTSITVCEGTPSVLYILSHEKVGAADVTRVYRTSNGGDAWSLIYDSRTQGNNFLGNAVQSQGWYNNVIIAKADDPNVVSAAGVTMVRSGNAGGSWSQVGGNVHVDHHAFAVDPANPNVLYNGNDGGMYRSEDFGATYSKISNGLPVNQFYAIAVDQTKDDLNYGGTQDNGTFSITSQGATRIAGGDGFYVVVDHQNPNIIYGEYPNGDLWKLDRSTGQIGDIVNGLFGAAQWSAPITMDPVESQTLFCGRENVFATVDGGDNWQSISPKVSGQVSAIAVSRANRNIIYAGSNRGSLIVSRDGGTNWSDYTFSPGLPNRYVADFATANQNEAVAYVSFGGFFSGHIFRTTDYGATWSDVSSNLPDIPVNALAIHPDDDNVIYAGTDLGVFVTVDGGASWATYMNGLPRTEVLDMEIHRARRVLRVATYGRSMWEIDLEKPVAPPSITSPVGGEVWTIGSTHTLGWAGFSGPVTVELSTDDGQTWSQIAQGVVGGRLRWNVPNRATIWARIRVTSADGAAESATSRTFTIEPMKLGGIVAQQSKPIIAYGLAFDGDHLYTIDFGSRRMLKLDANSLETVGVIETKLSLGDSLFTDLAYHPEKGNLFVHKLRSTTGAGPGFLYEMTRSGDQVNRWESPAAYPIGLAWMGTDNPELPYLLVSDRDGAQNIYLVDPETGEAIITIDRQRKIESGPRGATSAGGGQRFFQVITDFTGGTLKEATAEMMTVESQESACTIDLTAPDGILNARGIEYDPRDKNVWVTDYDGNIYKMVTCEGLTVPTSATPETGVASGAVLMPSSPNPFRGETEIAFRLAKSANAQLLVHDATGRRVATLVDGRLEEGAHRVRFAPTDLASGIYRCTLVVDGAESQTQTLIYVR